MNAIYAQKQSPAQKMNANTAASVVDSSSQGEALQRKADMASCGHCKNNDLMSKTVQMRKIPINDRTPYTENFAERHVLRKLNPMKAKSVARHRKKNEDINVSTSMSEHGANLLVNDAKSQELLAADGTYTSKTPIFTITVSDVDGKKECITEQNECVRYGVFLLPPNNEDYAINHFVGLA